MHDEETPKAWHGWHFWEGYLCSPTGNRYTPQAIEACFFYRQMKEINELLHHWPETIQ